MSLLGSMWRNVLIAGAGLLSLLAVATAGAAVDPNTLGKGEWIYLVPSAKTNTGTSTNQQLMDYLKSKGIKWVVVKCGDYGTWYSQFDSSLITAAHNSGLLIFGYQRVGGTNLTNEINIGKQCLATAADGYIIDAEVEFEGKKPQATQMMQSLRATYPNAFIAHAPLPYIDYHTAFPYVEFGTYCDAVMPQCYWKDIGITPTQMVTDLDAQWKKWHNTWTTQGNGAAIKPIIPIAQGHANAQTGAALAASEVTQFGSLIKADASPANPSGPYTGISFWSAQHHTSTVWTAIAGISTNTYAGAGAATIVDNGGAGYSETGTWSTSTSAGFYGTNSRYAGVGTAATATFAPTLATAGTYDVYAWWVAGTNRASAAKYRVTHTLGTTDWNANQTTNGGSWNLIGTFSFAAGSTGKVELLAASSTGNAVVVADAVRFVFKAPAEIIVDNTDPGFVASANWWTSTSTAGFYGSNYHTRGTASVSDAASWTATLPTTGSYNVYARWTSGANRSATAPYVVVHSGGSTTVSVNQQANGGAWQLLGTFNMNAGSAERVKLSCWTTAGYYVVADAVRFVPN